MRTDELDAMDERIVRILSLYEGLRPLQVWYELGESDGPIERVSTEEISERLEFLQFQGLVEQVGNSDTMSQGSRDQTYRLVSELDGFGFDDDRLTE